MTSRKLGSTDEAWPGARCRRTARQLCALVALGFLTAAPALGQDAMRSDAGRWPPAESPISGGPAAGLSAGSPASGQGSIPADVIRLPPIDQEATIRLPPPPATESPIFGNPPDRLALLPPSADGPAYFSDPRNPNKANELMPLAEPEVSPSPKLPPGFKNGFLQFTTFRQTYLLNGKPQTGFGMQDYLLQTTFALPFFTRDKPIFITPYFQAHLLNGPVPVDMPPEVYDVSLEFRILRQLNPLWGMDFALAPSILSDFHNMSSQAYRLTGRLAFLYTWSPKVQIAFGATATGRKDFPFLPIGGLIWTPTPDWRAEIIFPKPRILRRIADGPAADWWLYTSGEIGGNSYAIVRESGADDIATYKDLRFILGVERKADSGAYCRAEVGYVFDRSITYESNTPAFNPSDTVLLRGEVSF